MRLLAGAIFLFVAIGMLLARTAPRTWSDYEHAGEFVPATDLRITSAKCTNWNGAMFNTCTVTFTSSDGKLSGELEDSRFGRAPSGAVRLLSRRDDPSMVTTDISLATLGNRLAVVASLVVAGLFFVVCLLIGMFRNEPQSI